MTVSTQPLSERPDGSSSTPSAAQITETASKRQQGRRKRPQGRRSRREERRGTGRARRNTALLLALAGAVLLAAAAVFGYRFISENVLGPQAVAEEYLAALASGDQAAAYALLPETGAVVPQDPGVYASAGARISGFEITGQEIGSGSAVVQVLVTRDGERKPAELRLTEAGSQALIFTAWQLEATAARTVEVEVPPGTAQIRINGRELDLPSDEGFAEILLLPGSYILEGPQERFLSYGPAKTVLVEPGMAGGPSPVRLRASANTDLAAEVQAQGNAYLAHCLASAEAAPAACPNSAYSSYGPERIRDVQWVLERAPEYRITGTPETGLTVYAAGGKARVRYQEDTNGAGRWESRSDLVSISFSSGVEVAGESLGLDFRP